MSGWSAAQFKQFEANTEAYHAKFDGVKFEDLILERLNCSFSEINFANLPKGTLQTIMQCVLDAPCDKEIPCPKLANSIWPILGNHLDEINDVVTYVDINYGQTDLLTVEETVFDTLISISTSTDQTKNFLTPISVHHAVCMTLYLIQESSTKKPATLFDKEETRIIQAVTLCCHTIEFSKLDSLASFLDIKFTKANPTFAALSAISYRLTPFVPKITWPFNDDLHQLSNRCAELAGKLIDVDVFSQEKAGILEKALVCLALMQDTRLYVYMYHLKTSGCWLFDTIMLEFKDIENKEFQSWLKNILSFCFQH